MRIVVKAVLAAGILLLMGVGAAWADTCFQDANNAIIVGDAFTFPGAERCKVFNGYGTPFDLVMNGTACGTSDGSTIRFSLQFSGAPTTFPSVFFALMAVNRTTGTGTIQYCEAGQVCNGVIGVSKITCPVSRPLN